MNKIVNYNRLLSFIAKAAHLAPNSELEKMKEYASRWALQSDVVKSVKWGERNIEVIFQTRELTHFEFNEMLNYIPTAWRWLEDCERSIQHYHPEFELSEKHYFKQEIRAAVTCYKEIVGLLWQERFWNETFRTVVSNEPCDDDCSGDGHNPYEKYVRF